MASKVTIAKVDPADPAWARLIAGSPDGSIYATAEYLDVLCRAAGGTFELVGAFRGSELVGGIPLYQTHTRTGTTVGPRLLLYYLGPVLRRSETKYPSQHTARDIETLGALAAEIESRRYAKVILKGRHSVRDVRPFAARGWLTWPSYSYLVPLDDLAGQWHRVEQNLRRLIERCRHDGLTVTDDDQFDEFLRLHEMALDRHGAGRYLPPAPFRQWFESLRRQGLCRLFQARLPSGQAVAAQIVLLGPHPVSHTVCAGADPAHRQTGASAFLRWTAFERLAEAGSAANDLTDAALNPVTHFKSQFGGELVTNLVMETRGTRLWWADRQLGLGYRAARSGIGSLARRLLGRNKP